MKRIVGVLGLIIFSFYAQANDVQDAEALEVCKEIAAEEKLTIDDAKTYIEGCVKEITEDEVRERQGMLNSYEKS